MIKNNKALLSFLVLAAVVFVLLSYIDFRHGFTTFRDSGPSLTPHISITSYPAQSTANAPIEITWLLDTPTPRNVDTTTIYYDTISTPSALMNSDSPSAPNYQYSLTDYQSGIQSSPGSFTATIYPPQAAKKIFFRGYAYIDNQHYWTPEYTIKLDE